MQWSVGELKIGYITALIGYMIPRAMQRLSLNSLTMFNSVLATFNCIPSI